MNEQTVLYQLTETSKYMMGFVLVTRQNNVIVIDGGRPEDMPLLDRLLFCMVWFICSAAA